ncbi:MAG: SDR family oxidoreductase [Candidatus Binataceae bacterium]
MENTTNRVILVTGASSGLGRAMAQYFTARGDRVYGTSRGAAATATPWPMLALDVCSDRSVKACVGEVIGREGRVDVLINNAGHAFVGAVEETSLDEAHAQLETNFFGALRMVLAVVPTMRAQGSGRIINISSMAGAVPFPFLGIYGASKHALEAISESLEYELKGAGIHVTLIEPDGMRTAIAFHHPRTDHPMLAAGRRRLLQQLEHSTREDGNDPLELARAVAQVIDSYAPPLRVVIGKQAQETIQLRRSVPEPEFRKMISDLFVPNPNA